MLNVQQLPAELPNVICQLLREGPFGTHSTSACRGSLDEDPGYCSSSVSKEREIRNANKKPWKGVGGENDYIILILQSDLSISQFEVTWACKMTGTRLQKRS